LAFIKVLAKRYSWTKCQCIFCQ